MIGICPNPSLVEDPDWYEVQFYHSMVLPNADVPELELKYVHFLTILYGTSS